MTNAPSMAYSSRQIAVFPEQNEEKKYPTGQALSSATHERPQHFKALARFWLVFSSGPSSGFRTECSHGDERRERPVTERPGRTAGRGRVERRTSAGHDSLPCGAGLFARRTDFLGKPLFSADRFERKGA